MYAFRKVERLICVAVIATALVFTLTSIVGLFVWDGMFEEITKQATTSAEVQAVLKYKDSGRVTFFAFIAFGLALSVLNFLIAIGLRDEGKENTLRIFVIIVAGISAIIFRPRSLFAMMSNGVLLFCLFALCIINAIAEIIFLKLQK